MGFPVPPGFTITTDACRAYMRTGEVPDVLDAQVREALGTTERKLGRRFGDPANPLLVSVRSGSKFSCRG